ncbi:MAG TPA: methyltransferase domain-containing protein [Kouleothrix sp.]|uniref:SAM-dependent methyltransferase n=1 Tax=Kouleothrix sp. TaxID=2779161 RepID=UPI002B84CD6C|nr:methyltransferase domain-containing protein [Kouleothrix sp.]HRC75689.1 methyltransferase domain-containing protein [Kouleothrix sp.]
MSLRFHEIAEQNHRILNPFTEDQLLLLGEICGIRAGQRQLDLCCGKGEMLCCWSALAGITGVGVDISPVFLAAARRRAAELQVSEQVSFVEGNASVYPIAPGAFDIVSCIGATWIGGGLVGTLNMARPGLRGRDALLLVGEPYWIDPPPDEAVAAIAGGNAALFASLASTLERIESAGLELVEMVAANHHGWDRYTARQWLAVSDWLRANPGSPDAAHVRELHERYRREYMAYTRRYLGWAVFVLRQP